MQEATMQEATMQEAHDAGGPRCGRPTMREAHDAGGLRCGKFEMGNAPNAERMHSQNREPRYSVSDDDFNPSGPFPAIDGPSSLTT
ncbi:hypothetical protein E8E15_000450 [Penicillium rubens]|nr:hypothetical protein E8E15_000450 [Penicillium rubens]